MKIMKIVTILSLLVLFCSSCSPLTLKGDIESITLKCNERLEECTDQYYEDKKIFKDFLRAVESAKKMEGALDYEEEFTMTIKFEDKAERKFHLSLSASRGNTGLLLELPDTMQGYEIPISEADILRNIIYINE